MLSIIFDLNNQIEKYKYVNQPSENMLKQISNLRKNQFAKSSGSLFLINNLTNAFNYGLVIIAKLFLTNGFGLWISITSFLAITTVPLSSFTTVLSKKTSQLATNNQILPFNYYNSIQEKIKLIAKYYLFSSPILVVSMYYLLRFDSILIPIYIVILMFLTLLMGINNNFLIGLLDIKNYTLVNLCLLILRMLATVSLLVLGFQVSSLPLGSIFAFIAGLGLSYYLIKKIEINARNASNRDSKKNSHNVFKTVDDEVLFNRDDIKEVLQAMGYMLFLAILLNSDTVLSRTLFDTKENEAYGVVSIFGQIAHFGPISFSTTLIPLVVRYQGRKIYLASIAIVFALSMIITLIFSVFGTQLLQILKVEEQIDILPKILIYTLFITIFNIIYVSINYLIGRGVYKIMKYLFIILAVYLSTLLGIGSGLFSAQLGLISKTYGFIGVNIFFSFIIASGLFTYIVYAKHLDRFRK